MLKVDRQLYLLLSKEARMDKPCSKSNLTSRQGSAHFLVHLFRCIVQSLIIPWRRDHLKTANLHTLPC